MRRILSAVFCSALLVLALAAPAVADYPPSPTHTSSVAPSQSPSVSPSQSPSESLSPSPSVEGSETRSSTPSDIVLGTTVTVSPGSGGTAFTGSDLAAPLALGGILLIVGLALLYLGRRWAAASDR